MLHLSLMKQTMSSAECLREFINERLTVAAEEIFGLFTKTIVEYEEELHRQRSLLDIVLKPEVKLNRIELPQQHVCRKEKARTDQRLCFQKRNSSLDQEDPETPQIKEEQDEDCVEGGQLVLKQEADTFMFTPAHEDSDRSEDQFLYLNPDAILSVPEQESVVRLPVKSFVVSETNADQQFSYYNFHVAESRDQKVGTHGDSGSTADADAEPQQKKRHNKSHTSKVHNSTITNINQNTLTYKTSFKCDTCGKAFQQKSRLQRHMSVHTGERPYLCKICGKAFGYMSVLKIHIRTHTGEKPYMCKTCGRRFSSTSDLKIHTRIHTGEKPYFCHTCGKTFRQASTLNIHSRIHTGEKPCCCEICGKRFRSRSTLLVHTRIHTGEKPYTCGICGRTYRLSCDLIVHMRGHTGERPFACKTCGKTYFSTSHLSKHIKSHASL